jgi:DNA-binding NarL/FixJ family response regulator
VGQFRILVAEDHHEFRRLIYSTLQQREEFQIIGEALDGLEAVRLAEKLQPDVILLDIGLPRLNGLEATKLIRKLAPQVKILFLSQESSSDIVEECLRLGGLGYVQKMRTASDLLLAIDSVLRGIEFVSSGLRPRASADAPAHHHHEVLFSSGEEALRASLTRFVASALRVGNAAIILVAESRRASLVGRLYAEGAEIQDAMQRGTCGLLDATYTPDPIRVLEAVRASSEAAVKAGKRDARVAVCCERAGRLWAEGKTDEAVEVEQHCDDLAKKHDVDILCVYPSSCCQEDAHVFERIRAEHTAVHTE